MYTLEQVKDIVPKSKRNLITNEIIEMLNKELENQDTIEEFKENFITYSKVLNGDSKYKIKDYINAVKFVTLRMLNHTIYDSWKYTFPDRYKRLLDLGKSEQEIRPYSSMYSKNELVIQILKQTNVPIHVLNAPLHQEAINISMDIARNPNIAPIARVQAARTVLEYTKQPEVQAIQLDVGIKDIDEIAELTKETRKLADIQLKALEKGVITLQDIAESNIIDIKPMEKNNE